MKTWLKILIITLAVGIPAFLLEPNGPFGSFWAPAPGPEPSGIQIPLFIILGAAEAIMLGLGVSFLIFGYSWLIEVGQISAAWTSAAYGSIAWFLVNWWAHDSLHIHYGTQFNALLGIEYGFHITLMVAGLIIAYYFLKIVRQSYEH